METYVARPMPPVTPDDHFIIHRVMTTGSVIVTGAYSLEQACDLARLDRIRLRETRSIQHLVTHKIKSRKSGLVIDLPIPQ